MTGPLLPAVGLSRELSSYEVRSTDSYLDTPWGDEVRHLLTAELPEPWFALIHLWELHLPRHVSNGFDSWRFGRNRYERALSSLDAALAPGFRASLRFVQFLGMNRTSSVASPSSKKKETFRLRASASRMQTATEGMSWLRSTLRTVLADNPARFANSRNESPASSRARANFSAIRRIETR